MAEQKQNVEKLIYDHATKKYYQIIEINKEQAASQQASPQQEQQVQIQQAQAQTQPIQQPYMMPYFMPPYMMYPQMYTQGQQHDQIPTSTAENSLQVYAQAARTMQQPEQQKPEEILAEIVAPPGFFDNQNKQ